MSPPTRDFDLSNWLTPPHHRAAFQRVRELVPTALIRRSDSPRPLPFDLADPAALDRVSFDAMDGTSVTWAEQLARSAGDAVAVLHDGRVVYERYLNGMTERTPHLLMSVSKSICAAALGVAIDRRLIGLGDLVTDVDAWFAGTSLEGSTVAHLMDMTAGTQFVEDYAAYDDPSGDVPLIEYERQAGYRPLDGRPATGVLEHLRTYPLERPHGAWFSYRSPLTNVVARLLEAVHGMPFAEVLARDVWDPLGQEHDADVMLDHRGQAIVEGGISATLRDLARFGQTHLDAATGRPSAIPTAWVDDALHPSDACLAAFTAAPDEEAETQLGGWVAYHDAWWISRPGEQMSALGIFGQCCWIDVPRRIVIARFSTYPEALPFALLDETLRGFDAVASYLSNE